MPSLDDVYKFIMMQRRVIRVLDADVHVPGIVFLPAEITAPHALDGLLVDMPVHADAAARWPVHSRVRRIVDQTDGHGKALSLAEIASAAYPIDFRMLSQLEAIDLIVVVADDEVPLTVQAIEHVDLAPEVPEEVNFVVLAHTCVMTRYVQLVMMLDVQEPNEIAFRINVAGTDRSRRIVVAREFDDVIVTKVGVTDVPGTATHGPHPRRGSLRIPRGCLAFEYS